MGKPTDNKERRDAQDQILSSLARRALNRRRSALPTPSDLDDELLIRYLDGALSSEERTALERRLLLDQDAKERLGIVAGALHETGWGELPATDTLLDRATSAVSRYVFHVAGGLVELLRGGDGVHALQPATVRSASSEVTAPTGFQIDRLFQTAHGPLAARFELHAERADRQSEEGAALVDLVVHIDAEGKPVEGVRCKLLRDGRPVDSREVEAKGCTFTRLGPARYDVELRKGGVEIGRVLLDLRG